MHSVYTAIGAYRKTHEYLSFGQFTPTIQHRMGDIPAYSIGNAAHSATSN